MPRARRGSLTKLLLAAACTGWLACDGILGISAGTFVDAGTVSPEDAGDDQTGTDADSRPDTEASASDADASDASASDADASDARSLPDAAVPNVALAVATAGNAGCAVYRADASAPASAGGALFCWGLFENVAFSPGSDLPAVVQGAGTDVVDVAISGTGAFCVLHADGRVSCAGNNGLGELGRGSALSTGAWKDVQLLPANAVQLVAGPGSFCARLVTGEVDCWGDNSAAQLGDGVIPAPDGAVAFRSLPARSIGHSVVDLALAADPRADHACALLDGGVQVLCWGDNHDGRCGHPRAGDPQCPEAPNAERCSPTPTPVVGLQAQLDPGETVRRIALTRSSSCAFTSENRLVCWGGSIDGELDVPFSINTPAAHPLDGLRGLPDDLTPSNAHDLCVLMDGGLACDGDDIYGLLGPAIDRDAETVFTDYTVRIGSLRFVRIPLPARVEHAFIGPLVGLAALADGRVFSWGTGLAIGRTWDASDLEAPNPPFDDAAFSPNRYYAGVYLRTPAPIANLPPP